MCVPASMIVCQNRVYWNPPEVGESHTEIRRRNGLRDDMHGTNGVAIEITPPGHDFRKPFAEWVFKVDQDILPEWWNEREAEAAARDELPRWLDAHTIKGDQIVESGFWIVFEGSPTITMSGGEVQTCDTSAPVITQSGGHVQTYGNSTPTVKETK